MRVTLLSLLFFKAMIVFSQLDNDINKYKTEPQTNFEILVNGKKYVVVEGKELNIDTLIKPKITIKQSDYKKFENVSFAFEYPKHLSFDFNESLGLNTWTLSGNNIVILVFQITGKDLFEILVNEIASKFGRQNCVVENFHRKLGSQLCNGKTLKITLVGQSLIYDCYELESKSLFSNYLFIQDGMENKKHTEEYEDLLKHIDSTIVYK